MTDEQKNQVRQWVRNGISKDTVTFANTFGQNIAQSMTNSQIRNVFGEMRRIQMNGFLGKEKTAFILLKPKLAYTVKRFKEPYGLKEFFTLFSEGYDAVDTTNEDNGKKHFENFMHLMEAILAYHKYHGGKE